MTKRFYRKHTTWQLGTMVLIGILLGAAPRPANAITKAGYYLDCFTWRLDTWLGAMSSGGEESSCAASYQEYLNEQASLKLPAIGQPAIYAIAGVPQSAQFPTVFATQGQVLSVDFGFVDPATGLAVSGPQIGSVAYEVNADPLSGTTFVPIGMSSDAASNFSINYVFSTPFEPEIQAIPYDTNGNPIVITGLGGDNVASGIVIALVPEPSPAWFCCVGTLGIAFARWRSAKRRS